MPESRFLTDLILVPQGRGRQFALDAPLFYRSERFGLFEVPTGFICDLSSIPLGGLGFARPTDYPQAGVLHDWLYRTGSVSRVIADALYHEALLSCGAGHVRSKFRWAALRLFGWHAYRAGGRERE